MRAHKLKIWPDQFRAVRDERKTCEVRRADRDFREGDYLMLVEFDPRKDALTGDSLCRRVTHIHRAEDPPRGLVEGFVVLSVEPCGATETQHLYAGSDGLNYVYGAIEWLKP